MIRKWCLIFMAAVLAACAAQPQGQMPPSGLPSVESRVTEIKDLGVVPGLAAGEMGRKTLVVFDIDDTLLTSETFFGSDYWYEWQGRLPDQDPAKVPCRFDVIALNYEAGTQRRTQDDGPAIFNAITADRLILTSRSAMYRGATLRELQEAGYALPAPLGATREGVLYRWSKAAGSRVSVVSYFDGIFMTGGQDKGLVLLDLLRRLNLTYDRVVLVDDGAANIANMQAALKAAGIGYHGLHYTRIEKPQPPAADLARQGRAGWEALSAFLAITFPSRLEELKQGHCFY